MNRFRRASFLFGISVSSKSALLAVGDINPAVNYSAAYDPTFKEERKAPETYIEQGKGIYSANMFLEDVLRSTHPEDALRAMGLIGFEKLELYRFRMKLPDCTDRQFTIGGQSGGFLSSGC